MGLISVEVQERPQGIAEDGALLRVQPVVLTRDQAAAYLSIKPSWLANNAGSSRAPVHVKLGGQVRYLIADLDDWIRQQRVTV